jgi:hypothetical protein
VKCLARAHPDADSSTSMGLLSCATGTEPTCRLLNNMKPRSASTALPPESGRAENGHPAPTLAVPSAWCSSRNRMLTEVAGASTDQSKSLPIV